MTPIVVDFETYYAKDYSLQGAGLSTQEYILDERFKVHGAGIKIGHTGKSVWVPARFLPEIFARMELHKHALVGHNLYFDGSILAWHYGIYPKLYIDTLNLSYAIIGQKLRRHGLEHVSEYLLGLKKYPSYLNSTKGHYDLTPELERHLAKYCAGPQEGPYCSDVLMTWGILQKLLPHMPWQELVAQSNSVRLFTQPKVYLDGDMIEVYHQEVVKAKADALESVGLTNRKMLMSAELYANALRQLGVEPPLKRTKPSKKYPEGRDTYAFAKTDVEHKALLDDPDERVQALVAARLEVKSTQEETRSAKYARAAVLGPWPVHLKYAGAKNTLRHSGGDGGGGNPQNLKRGGTLRQAIYAPEGKIIFVPDTSQIEARITLWLGSKMPNAFMEFEALENLRRGEDIYSWFGSHIYGTTISKETHPRERQIAKSAVLGLGFGMGAERLIDYARSMGIYGMDRELAERVKNLYRSMFKGVKQLWNYSGKAVLPALLEGRELYIPNEEFPVMVTGRAPLIDEPGIRLPSGIYVKYPGLEYSNKSWYYYSGTNKVYLFGAKVVENTVQALAGVGIRKMWNELDEPGVIDVWHSVHDELPALVDDNEDAKAYAVRRANEIMRRAPSYFPDIPLDIEYHFGYRYGDAK